MPSKSPAERPAASPSAMAACMAAMSLDPRKRESPKRAASFGLTPKKIYWTYKMWLYCCSISIIYIIIYIYDYIYITCFLVASFFDFGHHFRFLETHIARKPDAVERGVDPFILNHHSRQVGNGHLSVEEPGVVVVPSAPPWLQPFFPPPGESACDLHGFGKNDLRS